MSPEGHGCGINASAVMVLFRIFRIDLRGIFLEPQHVNDMGQTVENERIVSARCMGMSLSGKNM